MSLGRGRFAEGTERSVHGAESDGRLFIEGHYDVSGNGGVTGEIKGGDRSAFFGLVHGSPSDFLVERTDLGEGLTLLG